MLSIKQSLDVGDHMGKGHDLGQGTTSWKEKDSSVLNGEAGQHSTVFSSNDSESTALGPVASTSPGNMLELKTASPHQTHGFRNSEAGCVLMSPGGDADAGHRV